MKETIRQRLQQATDRFEEVGRMLSSEDLDGGSQRFRELSMEYARLQPLAEALQRYHGLERELTAARELEADSDPGMRVLGTEEARRLEAALAASEDDLRQL